ncbi:hypothetical protein [Runella slithyformis]|nr:hypothetical protein [Runella slithyformis]
MAKTFAEKTLGLSFAKTHENEVALTAQNTLRRLVGILGMLLPVILYLLLLFSNDGIYPLSSISHYYYTRWSSVFVIIISLLAFFLIIYKGPDLIDFYLSTLAGLFALALILCPTSNLSGEDKKYAVTFLPENFTRENFHYVSAAIFLGCLALMSLFLFTKSKENNPEARPREKQLRNKIFRICGGIMIIAMLVILIGGLFEAIPTEVYERYRLTFTMETVAVESFGLSWLIKGGSFRRLMYDTGNRLITKKSRKEYIQ